MHEDIPLAAVPNDELLARLSALLQGSRRAESDVVAHIGEVDRRRLYARAAVPSMFAYCTEVLHLSEAEAYLRITAARAARQHPQLLAMLGDGRLHLSAIAKLSPHLTAENRDSVLRRATHRSKREVEELVAELSPRPDVPCLMRPLRTETERTSVLRPASSGAPRSAPFGTAGGQPANSSVELRPDGVGVAVEPVRDAAPPSREEAYVDSPPSRGSARPIVEPLAPSRYKVQFTASAELRDKLERLQALMRAELPDADLAAVIDQAVTQTLQRLEARRYARTRSPRVATAGAALGAGKPRPNAPAKPQAPALEHHIPSTGRHIPAVVRRAVFERDGGRCHYRDDGGRRCSERQRLEYHHIHPFGMGGGHAADNVRLMCRAHNLYLAEHDYGLGAMTAGRRGKQRGVAPSAQSDAT